jgi:hypothetical protein
MIRGGDWSAAGPLALFGLALFGLALFGLALFGLALFRRELTRLPPAGRAWSR